MATLSLEQVTKVFDNGVEAVSSLDLFVEEGEFVVLVGPSGCGKTTALRMVAGLEEVTAGTIRLDGNAVNDLSAKERDVAMVFQNYALYPHLNVLQNIAFSLRVGGMPKHERERKAREVAEMLGLTEVVLRKPGQLSGGQRQRVAMGRALVREPAVFLMDEPLSNLDASLRVQMRGEVLRVPAASRSRDPLRHPRPDGGDDDGRSGRGPPRRQAPAARRAAGALREPREPVRRLVHRLAGDEPVRGDGLGACGSARPVARVAAVALPAELVRRRPGLAAAEGRKLVAGIRPEHLTVAPPAVGAEVAGESTLSVRAELVESLGNESLLHFSTDARTVRNRSGVFTADPGIHASGDIAGASATEGVARLDPRVRIAVGDQPRPCGRRRSPPLLRRRDREHDRSCRRFACRLVAGGSDLM